MSVPVFVKLKTTAPRASCCTHNDVDTISSIRALFPSLYRGGRTHCDMLLLQHPALTETCCTFGSIYRLKTSKSSSFTLTLMITDSCGVRIIREIHLKSEQQLRKSVKMLTHNLLTLKLYRRIKMNV